MNDIELEITQNKKILNLSFDKTSMQYTYQGTILLSSNCLDVLS